MYNFYAKDYYYFLVFHMFKYSYWCINEIEQVNWSWEKKIYIERPKITLIGRVKQNMLITEVIKNIISNKIKWWKRRYVTDFN